MEARDQAVKLLSHLLSGATPHSPEALTAPGWHSLELLAVAMFKPLTMMHVSSFGLLHVSWVSPAHDSFPSMVVLATSHRLPCQPEGDQLLTPGDLHSCVMLVHPCHWFRAEPHTRWALEALAPVPEA